jgi:hypothetical protein
MHVLSFSFEEDRVAHVAIRCDHVDYCYVTDRDPDEKKYWIDVGDYREEVWQAAAKYIKDNKSALVKVINSAEGTITFPKHGEHTMEVR